MSPRSVVVGGGIAGLTAARALAVAGHDVVLIEADHRLGGKLRTTRLHDRPLDLGPDVFVTRDATALELCRQLGLEEELLAPTGSGAAIWARCGLRAWPSGLVLGVPTSVRGLWRSQVLSRSGTLRAALGLLLPGRRLPLMAAGTGGGTGTGGSGVGTGGVGVGSKARDDGRDPADPADPAVADVLGRLGDEVVETLLDPVLGGINGGDVRKLSLASTAPALAGRLGGRRLLLRALRGTAPGAAAPGEGSGASLPAFLGLAGGMGRLVERLAEDVEQRGVELRLGNPVVSLRLGGTDEATWTVAGEQDEVPADGLVLAVPAFVAARLLAGVAAELAAECSAIAYADVATASFAWPESAVPGATTDVLGTIAAAARSAPGRSAIRPLLNRAGTRSAPGRDAARSRLPGNGVLVPRRSGKLTTALTFVSTKWPRSAPAGEVVIRASTGRHGDERASRLGDDELVEALRREITELLGIEAAPTDVVLQRWPRSFPQFVTGHRARLARLGRLAGELPAFALAGAAFGGIGIPACVASGQRAAGHVQGRLQLAGATS